MAVVNNLRSFQIRSLEGFVLLGGHIQLFRSANKISLICSSLPSVRFDLDEALCVFLERTGKQENAPTGDHLFSTSSILNEY